MSLQTQVSAAEWQARCTLATLYRLIAHFRMTDLIDTHISLRVPDEPNHFLINHYGLPFERMRASDLVKINHDGDIVGAHDAGKSVNAAGFVIHSAIHAARPEVDCVIHTHTGDGMAVAAMQDGLLPLSQHALKFYQRLAYHDYEGIALDLDEQSRLVADLGTHQAMILRNHGLLTAAENPYRAFHLMYMLERACQAQVKALATGQTLTWPPEAVCARAAAQFAAEDDDAYVRKVWDAAVLLIEAQLADCCR